MRFKLPEIEHEKIQPCYCCGQDTDNIAPALGTALHFHICPLCVGSELRTIKGYLQVECPFHSHPGIEDMVRYWNALDVYNDKFGTKLTGTKIKVGINWEKELENLRKKWKEMLEKG